MGTLTALSVRAAREPGKYGDGAGLFLLVGKGGARSWILRTMVDGRRRDIGLGSAAHVSLAEAREKARETRGAIRQGIDPVAAKHASQDSAGASPVPTFREAAEQVHREHLPSWRNAKHAAQWLSTLQTYAFPALGDMPVDAVTAPLVRDVLAPIWLTIPETARRVRQRIGTVLDYAHAKGWRDSEAPMRAVSRGLPKQPKRTNHFAAVPWQEVPGFLKDMDETTAGELTKGLLRFVVLTAARSGEARGARWSEIDWQAYEWHVPAHRMKGHVPHVVPLSDQAITVLEQAQALRTSDDPATLVFPGGRDDRPISDMTLTMLLRRMGVAATVHGFRSSFRDWAGESTNFPREIAEMCLAHTVGNAVERAYRRSDLREKRRAMMAAWGAFCDRDSRNGQVLPLARAEAKA
jgi:integrase